MRKATIIGTVLVLLAAGCELDLMKEKTVDLVAPCEVCIEASHQASTGYFSSEHQISLGNEIDEVLSDYDLSRDDIRKLCLVSLGYEVRQVSGDENWVISGEVDVKREDVSGQWKRLLDYSDISLRAAVDSLVYVDLDSSGVEIINQALDSYLSGVSPTLRFRISNGEVRPHPTENNKLIFTWEFCLRIHVVATKEIEVPDPF